MDDTLTDLILEVFRLNGRLLAAGDELVRDLGLTSARWQVLGAVALAEAPLTVAGVARAMGLTRQAVQRLSVEMIADGLLEGRDNPAHRTARLMALTPKGREVYAAAATRQSGWVAGLGRGLDPATAEAARALLAGLRTRLETGRKPEGD
jgi:DNA-binding MarR family transcriptional regulator